MFYVLYPIGISAEWWLMYRSIGPSRQVNALLPPLFYFLLALYIPGQFNRCPMLTRTNGFRCLVHVLTYDEAKKEGHFVVSRSSS